MKPKVSERKKKKDQSRNNLSEIKKTTEKINETNSAFFEKVNKIDKSSGRLTEKNERTQINKIRNERYAVTTHTTETQKIIRGDNEQSQVDKLNDLEKMDKFLSTYNVSRPSHSEMENLSRPVTSKEFNQ